MPGAHVNRNVGQPPPRGGSAWALTRPSALDAARGLHAVAGCRRARSMVKGKPARGRGAAAACGGVLFECRSQAGPATEDTRASNWALASAQAPLLLSANKVLRGFEPRSVDSESRVLAVTP